MANAATMSNKHQTTVDKPTDNFFRLNPIAAGVRVVIAGGFIMGAGLSAVRADLPVPVQGMIALPVPLPVPSADVNLTKDPVSIIGQAKYGQATAAVDGKAMTIHQITDKAIIDWKSFNVDKGYTVKFDQPGTSSIALNRINQQDPSSIFGQIIANGQVYLYNRNGFVFGKDSVVDTNSFLASTLEITDEAFSRGITRVLDESGKPALGIDGVTLDPKTIKILIEAGAKIHTDKGGRIIIAAPTIENRGSLSADEKGQIILAASQDKVYLQAADKDSPFAGLVVEVDTGGKVENVGNILAKQGNVTLAGFAVNQQGRVTATSSVKVNGSIRLLAQEQHDNVGGKLVATKTTRDADRDDGLGTEAKLTFDSGSVTQIVADSDSSTAIDEQKQPQSYLEAKAHTVAIKSGSAIVVPGGKVDITATDNLASPTQGTSGRIHVDKDASIDVSGYQGVKVAMERNVGEISVQSYELRDAPLQKAGVLKGETVKVDLRKDTRIVDTSGAEARVERGIEERLSGGGEIKLTSSGDVVINDGAKIDISGGSVAYQDGYINTTKLVTDYGRIVDISAADPNEHYAAIYGVVKENHQKWGVEKVWNVMGLPGQGQFEQGYSEGKAAGVIDIKAPAMFWNGKLSAGSDNGLYQRLPGDRPDGGSFVFDSTAFASTFFQDVRFQTEKTPLAIALEQQLPKTADNRLQPLVLSADLTNRSKVQHVIVKTNGRAAVAEGTDIEMVPGGEFSIQAAGIDVQGKVHAAGGAINLTVPEKMSGEVNLGASSVLDVSGNWINDWRQESVAALREPLYLDGGSVKVRATGDVILRTGAAIKADGAAGVARNGKVTAGKGGKIELAAVGDGVASKLHLDGRVSAASMSKGGTLTLNSGEIILGTGVPKTADPLTLAVINGQFAFDPKSSFGAINLIGNFEGVTVGSDVRLDLKTKNRVLDGDFLAKTSGSDIFGFSHAELLPEHLRQPFQLSLIGNTDVVLSTGSAIVTDKQSTVNLASSLGGIYVDGLISTPAGKINLAVNPRPISEYNPSQSVRLGSHAKLLAQGTARMNPLDVLGRRSGEILDGGQISFDLKRGYLIAEQGSLIDVSGTQGVLDLPKIGEAGTSARFTPVKVASDAGSISISAAEGVVLDGRLRGQPGSASSGGGRFSLTLDNTRRQPPVEPIVKFPDKNLLIRVVQEQQPSFGDGVAFGDDIPEHYNGQAVVAADLLQKGGFSDVRLSTPNEIRFQGDVSLAARGRLDFDAAKLDWEGLNGAQTGTVNLNTALLRMGSSQQREVSGLPLSGGGQFNAHAQWMELFGATRWDGFNRINLASAHDLRTVGLRFGAQREFLGAMVAAADINLEASQIYPTTLSKFTFAVKNNPDGRIDITGRNTDKSPLSAAGELSFEAPVINQSGVIKAPMGTIRLKAGKTLTLGDRSLTSVSAAGLTIPFGVTQGGLDWLYPLDSVRNLVFDTPPEKRLVLQAPEVVLDKGSTVDISGGGDLYAYEFQPGSGGSYDYLKPGSATYEGGFAVVPNLGSDLAPYDHYESAGSGIELGSKVYLAGSDNLPAGQYTVLPAHYALLPGAFLVTPQGKTQDQTVTTYTSNGQPIVAGYRFTAGSGAKDSRWSGFRIESGGDIRKRSQYEEHLANEFYTAKAQKNETAVPLLPEDAGQISIIAQNKLVLDSRFLIDAVSGGRGARMDIAADNIRVVDQLSASPEAGTLEILSGDLSALKIDSLMLGGARSRNKTTGATDIEVSAKQVVFAADSKVHVSDMIVAASDLVDVREGAELVADGKVNTGDTVLNVDGDGALLRISGDKQVVLNRVNTPGVTGELRVAEGSKLSASKSMLLDSSQSTQLLGDIEMQGGSLNLGANTINIGEVDHLGGNALNLSNRKLLNLAVDELVLTGRDSIGIYGNLGLVDGNGLPVMGDDGLQKAVQFERLVINTAGFTGHGAVGDRASIQAGSLRLQNTAKADNLQAVDGHGQLNLSADRIEIADGNFGIQGFDAVNIEAGNELRAVGEGHLKVASDLNVTTAALTADGGANVIIEASAHHARFNGSASDAAIASGLGAIINVVADAVDFDSKVLLPTGDFGLHALAGDVNFGAQASADLAGRADKFADKVDHTPGGNFKAVADHGKVVLAEGSAVDMSSGGGNAAGGMLTLKTPEQSVVVKGSLKAAGGGADIDVAHFEPTAGFDDLMKVLNDAGINQSIYFRSRHADIEQSAESVIDARSVTLVADSGAIDLAGQIHADAVAAGGVIQVYAGDGITLKEGSALTAKGAKGGEVFLSSVDSDNDDLSGIDLQAGSSIDVGGATAEKGGKVTLRALRDGNGVMIQPILDGTVKGYAYKAPAYDADGALTAYGYSKFYAEGVQRYTDDNGFITSADIDAIKIDTDAYMTAANMRGVADNLGNGIRLMAGVELSYNGDLVLSDQWDFADWRYSEGTGFSDMPGHLVVRASGMFTISEDMSISDGFKDGVLIGNPGIFELPVAGMLMRGDSWSYGLAAGADLTGADTAATASEKNLVIAHRAKVRTGSGDMQLVAGGDIVFTDQTSTVYNAGRPTDDQPYGTMDLLMAITALSYADYPVEGGDLVMKAGKDIKGAVTDQFIDGWLVKQGDAGRSEDPYLMSVASNLAALENDAEALAAYKDSLPQQVRDLIHDNIIDTFAYQTPTTWGVVLSDDSFQQNVGSFGGGKVEISAAGNITDLSVMMPTTGKQTGTPAFDANNPETLGFLTNQVEVQGGGTMHVRAGGDIAGGAYYLGQGQGSVVAEGAIKGGSQFASGPQIAMGDAHIELQAKKDLSLAGVSDAMMMHAGNTNFFSYGEGSAVVAKSLSGDLHLGADVGIIGSILAFESNQATLAAVYPGSLQATAFGGSVILDNEVVLFPSAKGELNLLAEQNITSKGDATRLAMSDADRVLLPTALSPLARNNMSDAAARINPFGLASLVHAATPVHAGDNEPARLVTRQGDIKNIQFNLAKQAVVHTGRDFSNVLLNVQHANPQDVSLLDVGRDLKYTSDRSADGGLNNNTGEIKIAGAGEVLVKAGRNVDLGASGGISTVGNVYNTGLPDQGANLTILPGANGKLDYSGFISSYLQDKEPYAAASQQAKLLITAFMKKHLNDDTIGDAAALEAFAKLANEDFTEIQPQLNAIVLPVFFNEIKESGKASAGTNALGNERGFTAIDKLFPGSAWKGDLSMFFSKIQTIDGGNIDLLVPGGQVNAGLAASFTGAKPASELGIVVQRQGDINVMVQDDFMVNTSRVFALDGGDILVWSSAGDIDAGRGAKSAIAAPPPVISFDESGNLKIEFPPIVSGSGIRTAASSNGVQPGDVFLFAPRGVIDAGEAGIGGNNVFIVATAVLGANNIQVSGVGTGVPVAASGSVAAGLTGTSNMTASVSQMAESSINTNGNNDRASAMKNAVLGMLSVELLGFGE